METRTQVNSDEQRAQRIGEIINDVFDRRARGEPVDLAALLAQHPDRPFRCPKTTYDALARVMATTTKLTKFPDIEKLLKKELGELPAVYQIRVALQFWTTPAARRGGLVERIRARYRTGDPAQFVRAAGAAWSKSSS